MLRYRTLLLAGLLLLPACARYEYDLVQPRVEQPRIGTKDDLLLDLTPVRYHLLTVDNRLTLRAFNSSPGTLELVGVRSSVVDPTGQARPISSQPIPSGAFVKLIMPPIRPEFVSDSGSRVYYGYGPGLSRSEYGFGYDEPPTRYTLRDGNQNYWDWKGETPITLTLVYKQADNSELTHTLRIQRVRVK